MELKRSSEFSFSIAYTIYNKGYLIESILRSLSPLNDCQVLFFFDNCSDNSLEEFKRHHHLVKNVRAFVNASYDFFEVRANNFLLKMSETPYCILVQDDVVLKDVDSILSTALEIFNSNLKVGLIGFKDGYEMEIANQYYNFISAPWSTSKSKNAVLSPGKYENRTFINRGPLCLSREVLKDVGCFDEKFYPLFWDDNDLSLRCVKSGFKNYVAYGDILSKIEWGATRSGSKIPCRDINISNQIKFSKKWNMKHAVPFSKTIIPNLKSLLMRVKFHLFHEKESKKVFEL